MNNRIIKFIVVFVLLISSSILFGQSNNSAKAYTEQQKIDFLISKIENLVGAKFIRNGTAYDAKAAAEHLRMKREKAGSSIKTVNDFIEKVASQSSVSGEPYIIEYSNGKKQSAREFYFERLKELNEQLK